MTDFKHTDVTSLAGESPTVQLVQYLVDQLHEQLGADVIFRSDLIRNAEAFLVSAGEQIEFIGDDENLELLRTADPIIEAITALITKPTEIHSLVINWNDHDPEEGTFGTTVRAWSYDHAEYIARAQMETLEFRGSEFYGAITDHNRGATWLADDLEKALRSLLAAAKAAETLATSTEELGTALERAGKVLAEIAAIN